MAKKSNELINSFVNEVFKTAEEYNTIPIPELCNIPYASFQNNEYYDEYGFKGISGVQVITPSQTAMFYLPMLKYIKHIDLFASIFSRMYVDPKRSVMLNKLSNDFYNDISIFDDDINRLMIRYVNVVDNKDDEITSENLCVIYGKLDKLNSYQKEMLLESVKAINKKDPNIQILDYTARKKVTVESIEALETKEMSSDPDEKLISNEDVDFVANIQSPLTKDKTDCFYNYDKNTKKIWPIVKFGIEDYDLLKPYGIEVLNAKTLNKMIINGTRVEMPGIYTDPDITFKDIFKGPRK